MGRAKKTQCTQGQDNILQALMNSLQNQRIMPRKFNTGMNNERKTIIEITLIS
jgi:DNA polymerase III gamma/tau subunit